MLLKLDFPPVFWLSRFRWETVENHEEKMSQEAQDLTVYNVVVNHEEAYSIWPADRQLPLGWRQAGKQGTKEECLAYIQEVWTDMRPLSLRKKMEETS